MYELPQPLELSHGATDSPFPRRTVPSPSGAAACIYLRACPYAYFPHKLILPPIYTPQRGGTKPRRVLDKPNNDDDNTTMMMMMPPTAAPSRRTTSRKIALGLPGVTVGARGLPPRAAGAARRRRPGRALAT
jgi:hypothetical protein